MGVALQTANFLLATAQWLIVGRLFLRLFIRNPKNAVWQMLLIATDPPYRISRFLTGGRVAENWLWLVSLLWLLVARIALARLAASVAS